MLTNPVTKFRAALKALWERRKYADADDGQLIDSAIVVTSALLTAFEKKDATALASIVRAVAAARQYVGKIRPARQPRVDTIVEAAGRTKDGDARLIADRLKPALELARRHGRPPALEGLVGTFRLLLGNTIQLRREAEQRAKGRFEVGNFLRGASPLIDAHVRDEFIRALHRHRGRGSEDQARHLVVAGLRALGVASARNAFNAAAQRRRRARASVADKKPVVRIPARATRLARGAPLPNRR